MSGYLTTEGAALAQRTGRGIRIAVIDSGVAPDHPHVGSEDVYKRQEVHIPLFEHALDRARERGVVVVSARSHAGVTWYPGGLPGAIGVLAAEQLPRHALAVVPGTLGAGVQASPYPRPIPGVPVERNLSGVSFAVANASGIIACALEAGAPRGDSDALLAWIAARAVPRGEETG